MVRSPAPFASGQMSPGVRSMNPSTYSGGTFIFAVPEVIQRYTCLINVMMFFLEMLLSKSMDDSGGCLEQTV
jgi:hypothetical protein